MLFVERLMAYTVAAQHACELSHVFQQHYQCMHLAFACVVQRTM